MEESQNSLSDDIKEQTDKYQKKANDLLKKSDTTEKEVIEFIEEVRNKSLYKFEYEETQEKLLDGESFEIIKKENINPIFLLNLINCDEIVLSKIDYNYFNNYVFEEIYKIYLDTEIFELKCAIISRLDEIIELENNFLLAYLNTYNNIIMKEKNKEKKFLMNIQDYQSLLSKTYIFDK